MILIHERATLSLLQTARSLKISLMRVGYSADLHYSRLEGAGGGEGDGGGERGAVTSNKVIFMFTESMWELNLS